MYGQRQKITQQMELTPTNLIRVIHIEHVTTTLFLNT
jgi:hypothetical protein